MRLVIAAVFAIALNAQSPAADPWKQLDFLIGKWTGAAGEKDTAQAISHSTSNSTATSSYAATTPVSPPALRTMT